MLVELRKGRASRGRRLLGWVTLAAITTAGVSLAHVMPAPAHSEPAADIAVGLDAFGGVAFPMARYTVSVTNNGPATTTSAIVTVQLDARTFALDRSSPCPYDSTKDTAVCTFGAVAVGATVTSTFWAYYLMYSGESVNTTATRTTSAPQDPVSGNDSASVECWWYGGEIGAPPGVMYC